MSARLRESHPQCAVALCRGRNNLDAGLLVPGTLAKEMHEFACSMANEWLEMARRFGAYPPVDDFLGKETLEVLAAPDRIESYIIETRQRGVGFVGCSILAKGPLLTDEQGARLRGYILSPEAHHNGCPIFKRLPFVPNFSFRVWQRNRVLDVLIDLHNAGWQLHCGTEHYGNWNWVGGEIVCLAKELFTRFASSSSRAIWQRGTIKALQER